MGLVFIDANMYLNFFDAINPEYKQLLDTLNEIKDQIFITRQIVFEVERNKIIRFKSSFSGYIQRSNLPNIRLPEQLGSKLEKDFEDWNREREVIATNWQRQKKKLETLYLKTLERISKSNDPVSTTLREIFNVAVEETKQELNLARERKERGNPPGKTTDPLGDQITWEQLLSNCIDKKNLWIITQDTDFVIRVKDKCFLNPFLIQELKQKNKHLVVHVFDSLADGIKSYNDKLSIPIKKMPSVEVLSEISEREKQWSYFSYSYDVPAASTGTIIGSSVVSYPPVTFKFNEPSGYVSFPAGGLDNIVIMCSKCRSWVQKGSHCAVCGEPH